MTIAVLLCSLAGLVYIYAGYPLLVWLLARAFGRAPRREQVGGKVSVVVVAHNEGPALSRKLDSIFASDGDRQIDEVVIASDGSTDDTANIIRNYGDPRIRLLAFPERRGKPAVLNDVVPTCHNEIVVLTDARQELHPAAIGELAANFADETVGVVSGELVFRESGDSTTAAQGIGFYWKYEKFIRKCESRFRSVPGATGALYAIRKQLFRPIDSSTLLDDVAIPMQAIVQGFRCVFEPAAIAFDAPSKSPGQEAIRKRRTIAGNAQLLVQHPEWLLPWKNPIVLQFVSHKILRLVSPALLIAAFVTNLLLAAQPLYHVLLTAQVCFYVSATVGWLFQRSGTKSSCFGPSLMLVTLNVTTLAAMWDALRGRYRVTWQKTAM